MNITEINPNTISPSSSPSNSAAGSDPQIQALEQKLKQLTKEKKEALRVHDEKKAEELEKKIQEIKKQLEQLKAKEKNKENDTQDDSMRKSSSNHSLDYLI